MEATLTIKKSKVGLSTRNILKLLITTSILLTCVQIPVAAETDNSLKSQDTGLEDGGNEQSATATGKNANQDSDSEVEIEDVDVDDFATKVSPESEGEEIESKNDNDSDPTTMAKVYGDNGEPAPNYIAGDGVVVGVPNLSGNASGSGAENASDSDTEGKAALLKGRIKVACWDYRTMGVYNGSVVEEKENGTEGSNSTEEVKLDEEISEGEHAELQLLQQLQAEDEQEQGVSGLGAEEPGPGDPVVVPNTDDDTVDETDADNVAGAAAPELQDMSNRSVEIVNITHLLHDTLYSNSAIKLRTSPANCTVVMFYATWCPFSAKAAPHFNALPRAYPPLRVAAIDSSKYKTVNTYFGILSVPTIVLFHNGRIIAKFNDTQFTLNKFAEFIEYFTDLNHEERMNVTTKDFDGPLSSVPTKEIDWYLYISWVFLIGCFLHYVSKSVIWRRVVDFVRTTWREAEAQHEHID